MQADHRIELDRPDLGAFPHDLLVDLALGRDVDHDVAQEPRLAAEAALAAEPAAAAIALLDLAERRDVVVRRADAVLGELALGDRHLAAPAQAAAAAHRIDVDAERARDLEQRRAEREAAAPARRREDDERGSLTWTCSDGAVPGVVHARRWSQLRPSRRSLEATSTRPAISTLVSRLSLGEAIDACHCIQKVPSWTAITAPTIHFRSVRSRSMRFSRLS